MMLLFRLNALVLRTIAGNVGRIVWPHGLVLPGHDVIGAIHETKVGAPVEHIEIDTGFIVENVGQNFRELLQV